MSKYDFYRNSIGGPEGRHKQVASRSSEDEYYTGNGVVKRFRSSVCSVVTGLLTTSAKGCVGTRLLRSITCRANMGRLTQ